jgi:hypothetical protein
VIDIRRIDLGPVTAGEHTFMIRVPTAVFAAQQGNFPLSLYFQGTTSGTLVDVHGPNKSDVRFKVYPNPANGRFTVELPTDKGEITVTNVLGEQVLQLQAASGKSHLHLDRSGVYMVHLRTEEGYVTKRLVVGL